MAMHAMVETSYQFQITILTWPVLDVEASLVGGFDLYEKY